MMKRQEQIKGIIPAHDWLAVFTTDEGEERTTPLTCFALIEEEGGLRYVVGLDAADDGIHNVEDSKNFCRYMHSRYGHWEKVPEVWSKDLFEEMLLAVSPVKLKRKPK